MSIPWGEALEKDGHSIFAPSHSATWLFCEDALYAGLETGEDYAGVDAAVGTVFHDIMHEWLTKGEPAYRLHDINQVRNKNAPNGEYFEVVVDEDMFFYGKQIVDYLEGIDGDMFVETWVSIDHITPIEGQGGTADVAFCRPGVLDITDHKYGTGVKVFARWNTQALCYASGFFRLYDRHYDFQKIIIRIAQPRLNHFDVFEITREELIEWEKWAKERAAAAGPKNMLRTRTPGPKQCLWCRCQRSCSALETLREELADASFDEAMEMTEDKTYDRKELSLVAQRQTVPAPGKMPDPLSLTTAQLSHIYKYRKLMEAWYRGISEELITRGLHGEVLGGNWEIGESRTRRNWIDEDATADRLRLFGFTEDEIFTKKLVSPNQSQKLWREAGIRGKAMEEYVAIQVDKPKGRPTLVPIGDAREAIPDISDVFDDIETGGEDEI